MIITGIAHPPEWLNERSLLPSAELIFLAKKSLKSYRAAHLITSLEPGWDQALAKAAVEQDIAYTVALPHPSRDADWKRPERQFYLDLLSRAVDVYQLSEACTDSSLLECHYWRVDHADALIALWDYEFVGNTYKTMSYALQNGKEVVNLWQDWQTLFTMRKQKAFSRASHQPKGAQIYDQRGQASA